MITLLQMTPAAWLASIPATGGLALFFSALAILAAGMVWQILLFRRTKKNLLERQEKVRGLESLLRISARIHGFRETESLLTEVAESVRESLGFRMVLLRIYDAESKTFEAAAFAGIDENGIEYLKGMPVSLADFKKMIRPIFKVSNSYFYDHNIEESLEVAQHAYTADLGIRHEGEWDERDMLIVPLMSPEGEITGYLSVDDPVNRQIPGLNVITLLEMFATQAATAIASAELYTRLYSQNRELMVSADQLSYHNELKNNFVANVSHELRTPLTSIKAYSEALMHGHETMSPGARNEFLAVVNSESEKLAGIVNNLLDLEKIEGNQVTFNRHQTDVVALVKGMVGTARTEAAAKNINFRVHFDQQEIHLTVDDDLVRQMIRHLLDNAFKFTAAGGNVSLSVIDGVSSVRFIVEDDGNGIPSNKMAYIFDRFYQVDGTSTREHGGQGVGLSICRDIVMRHGGRIWSENVVPQGTRFIALLPRKDEIVRRADVSQHQNIFSDTPDFSEKVIHWIAELMRVRMVSLMIPDVSGDRIVIEAAVGLTDHVVQNTSLARGEGVAGQVWHSGKTMLVGDITDDERVDRDSSINRYDTGSLLSVPVKLNGRVVGVVNVNNRLDQRPFSQRDQLLLEGVADRLGHILDRVSNHIQGKAEYEALRKTLRQSVAVRRSRHDDLAEICHEICIGTASNMKMNRQELSSLAFALQTYDLGLTDIPDDILNKVPPLEPDEWEMIKHHVFDSMKMLSTLDAPGEVHDFVLHHHEQYDGGGYPDGLAGEDIPIGSRLLALTDSLVSMLQGRPYRQAMCLTDALSEIESRQGQQFCPRSMAVFVEEAMKYSERIAAAQTTRVASPLWPTRGAGEPVGSSSVNADR